MRADGTQYDFYENNLLAGYHHRYRKMGAVAYRHVADNYIAVFRHFIPPGVWEAIYVIEPESQPFGDTATTAATTSPRESALCA